MNRTRVSLSIGFVVAAFISAAAQQTDNDAYIKSYRAGQFEKTVSEAKLAARANGKDWRAYYYAGLALLQLEREKDATKSLEKAVNLNNADSNLHSALAYAYLVRNDKRSQAEATASIKIDPKNAQANYVMAVTYLRVSSYSSAYKYAKWAIEASPKLGFAYLVKSQALVSSFVQQQGSVEPEKGKRYLLLKEAVADVEKFLELEPTSKRAEQQRRSLESLRFFARYYEEHNVALQAGYDDSKDPNRTPLKVLDKRKANYTPEARKANISGEIRLLVGFAADGKVKNIMVVKSLGYGLDEEAIAATAAIRFEPEKVNGVPVDTIRPVYFTFNIY